LIDITKESSVAIATALASLRVHPVAMKRNLALNGGIAMAEALSTALTPHIGRSEAMQHVEKLTRSAQRDGRSLRDVASTDAELLKWLSAADIDRALAPGNFIGSAETFVANVLRAWAM